MESFKRRSALGKISMTATDLATITTVTYDVSQTDLEEWHSMYDTYWGHVDLEEIAVQ